MKNKTRILFLISTVVVMFFGGCKKKYYDDLYQDYSEIYAATKKGRYVIYDVDSIKYSYLSPFQQNDTVHYQVKELIADTFSDNVGRVNYRIELYKRYFPTNGWDIDRVWYSYRTKAKYERVEDDLRFIKMIYPPVIGQKWNGNQNVPYKVGEPDLFDYLEDWQYQWLEYDVPKTINNLKFQYTATIEEVNVENLIDKKLSKVTYAKDVGIIEKEWTMINKQDVQSGWDNPQNAYGFKIIMRVNSFKP